MKVYRLFGLLLCLAISAAYAQKVAVFSEPGFPSKDITALATPAQIRAWLTQFGIENVALNANQLADPKVLNAKKYPVLIMPYGSTYKSEFSVNIAAYHKSGGSIICAGEPFTIAAKQSGATSWIMKGSGAQITSLNPYSGTKCLQINKQTSKDWDGVDSAQVKIAGIAGQNPIPVTLSAMVKSNTPIGREDGLRIIFLDSKGNAIEDAFMPFKDAEPSWKKIELKTQVPASATSMQASIRIYSPGALIYIDDVRLVYDNKSDSNLLNNSGFEQKDGGWQLISTPINKKAEHYIGMGTSKPAPQNAVLEHNPKDLLGLGYISLPQSASSKVYQPEKGEAVFPILSYMNEDEPVGTPTAMIKRTFNKTATWDCWLGSDIWVNTDRATIRAYRTIITVAAAFILMKKQQISPSQYRIITVAVRDAYTTPSAPKNAIIRAIIEPNLMPKSEKPSSAIDVVDARKFDFDDSLTLVSLQGLVNRKKPRIFVIWTDEDRSLLGKMQLQGYYQNEKNIETLSELIAKYQSEISGCVIPDSKLTIGTHIAVMASAVHNAVIAPANNTYNLTVSYDLRNRFKTNKDALVWVQKTLEPELSRLMASVTSCARQTEPSLDYLIQHKGWVLWLTGAEDYDKADSLPLDELEIIETILESLPACQPLFGSWSTDDGKGVGDAFGDNIAMLYGKYRVALPKQGNMSVLSGIDGSAIGIKPRTTPELERPKAYVSLILCSRNALGNLTSELPDIWNDNERGKIPLAYAIPPLAYNMMPTAYSGLAKTARNNDQFIIADSGVGSVSAHQFGCGYRNPQDIFNAFYDQTGIYAQSLGIPTIIVDSTFQDSRLQRFSVRAPYISTFFRLHPASQTAKFNTPHVLVNDKPVIRCYPLEPANSKDSAVNQLTSLIKSLATGERPAFVALYTNDSIYSPSVYAEAIKKLGEGYVPVLPTELGTLYKRAVGR